MSKNEVLWNFFKEIFYLYILKPNTISKKRIFIVMAQTEFNIFCCYKLIELKLE